MFGTIFYLICATAGAIFVYKGTDMLDSTLSSNSGGEDGLSNVGLRDMLNAI